MTSSCVMSWFSSVLFEKRLFLVFSRLPTAHSLRVFTPNSQLSLSGTLNWDISWFTSDGPIYSVAIISLSLCRRFLSFFLCSLAIAVVCLRYYTIYYTTSSASAASGFGPIIACWVHKWPICRSRFKSQLKIVSELSPSTRWQPVYMINEFQWEYVIFSHFSSLFRTHATGHQLPPKRPSQSKVRNPPSTLQVFWGNWFGLGTASYPTIYFTSGPKLLTSQVLRRSFAWMNLKIAQQWAQSQKGSWFKFSWVQGHLLCEVCTFSQCPCGLVTLNWP